MDEASDKIVRLKLSDQVFRRLRQLVASGELSAGDVMPSERALMERFGVGRPAVREALQAMQNKGLITITHGGRSRVNALTAGIAFNQLDDIVKLFLSSEPANIEHLKQIRFIFEIGTVQLAAQKCTVGDADDLAALIEEQRGHLGDAEQFMKSDIAFHTRIATIAANPLIHSITEIMLTWLFEYHSSLLLWSGREETTLTEHTEILTFLRSNKDSGAIQAMQNHLNRAGKNFSSIPRV